MSPLFFSFKVDGKQTQKSFGPWINGSVNEADANRCLVFKEDRHRNRQIKRGLVAHKYWR